MKSILFWGIVIIGFMSLSGEEAKNELGSELVDKAVFSSMPLGVKAILICQVPIDHKLVF